MLGSGVGVGDNHSMGARQKVCRGLDGNVVDCAEGALRTIGWGW